MEKTSLKLVEKLEKINEKIEKAQNVKNSYRINITEKNKAIILSKNAQNVLNDNGINLQKVYISYNATPELYNTIEQVLKDNSDVFTNKSTL